MDYNDFYILSLLKRLNQQLGLLLSQLGNVISIVDNPTTWVYWEAQNNSNAAPPDPTKAVTRRFYNGDPPVTWDPTNAVWR